MSEDGRRRRYVPLDVHVAHGDFGTRLLGKWGMEGLCTWMLYLAACKRETVQGTFTYVTEAEAWGKLGATASGFSIDEFFQFTGRLKKTRKTRHGRVSYVLNTAWKDWNKEFDKQQDAEQKSRKPGTNASKKHRDSTEDAPTEVEVDLEGETPYPLFERYVKNTGWQYTDDSLTEELKKMGAVDLAVKQMLILAARLREEREAS